MKNTAVFLLILVVITGGIFSNSLIASASVPTLSINPTGSGDSVQISVYGDANSSVVLYYQQSGYYSVQSQYIGSTNYSGYLSTTINKSTYNINSGSSVYVVVNNQQSSSANWPYSYGYNYGGTPSVSQTSISLTIGQSTNVTVSGGSAPYSMYPGSPNLYQASISGNTLTLVGQNTGSDTLRICSSGSTTSCANLYININTSGTGYNSQVSLGQNSVSINSGSSATISIYGSGSYYISSNSNPNIATATISGNIMTVYGVSYGSDNITVCQSGGQCAVLYVSVGYGNNNNYSSVSFSQVNPVLSIGQVMNVSVYGGDTTNYNVAYNSNTSVVQSSLSGGALTITGLTNGSSAIVVCSSARSCAAISVTVGSGSVLGAQNNWTYCAAENGYCNFYGTQLVRYGANGVYYYRTLSGGVTCTNAVFGDPIFGVAKQCSYGGSR
ncbi:MAG: Alpha-L-rhamnosidase [Candidatus Yanofskybacteria bacterium GW2011_GWF1_44_227]|uniref:Alpha-L-rhamnosidase n=1 Tax=Candidatus Yanofskybacteria bacterium GW2011_GWE2_40_11 TaxID=1619033 RepID=A0A0G0T039_9BACT|nr:MAG: Alpha-L-rhamnosidase [Candidatus Yanofskybacteria bacterium GW2011_GWE1_40_10]KKR40495.1 MAG: Alpha-L-rhamnosidase [Candidatus Yanofskybacteria bacterium GW2011_GWE2_40_11]KKT15437.1 MAG: Alpha-L-rhamnosidase [Candidatus Yanofskybacteria bacterium GW2011_GWF2_43_596]KKT53147.1 MAG: Alpha-L-rhamnosidase [Candidatus Yanofskybacteria bacterium GW2011_GWF1_44_227]OGN35504.1 MAG: hypothetical protein A2207_02070 [Candidatus Yanofskybacteria bacterium RIFOXYA1_FULL_44_17]OGN36790.1 MAG: hypo